MKLSIAMIVKNEEKNIEKCLVAIHNMDNKIDYEIIVVDTGSIDNTVEIAKKYTDKVYYHEWNGNFGEMRNISINYCKGEWILILDADEVLENTDRLVEFVTSNEGKKYNAAEIIIKNLLDGNENNYITANLFRLFKRNKEFYYVGRVHEQPRVIVPYTNSRVSVLHYGYSREDYEVMKYKYERNKKLLEEDLKRGIEPIYTRFQLAQTYSMANETIKALDIIKEAYDLDKKRKDGKSNINVYHFYSRELVNVGNYEKAIKVSKEGIEICKSSMDFYYVLATSYKKLGQYDKAIENFSIYFTMHDKKSKGILVHEDEKEYGSLVDYSFTRKDEMIITYIMCLYEDKRYKEVIKEYEKISGKDVSKSLEPLYLYSLLYEKKYDVVKKIYNKKIDDKDIEDIISVLDKIDKDHDEIKIKDVSKNVLGIDKRLDSYIRMVYFEENVEIEDLEIKLEEFYVWKAVILKLQLPNNIDLLQKIKICKKHIINNYIAFIQENYECLKVLYEYSEKMFLSNDIRELILVNIIDSTILFNPSVNGEKRKKLIKRSFVNNVKYINYVYKEEIIDNENYSLFLDNYESLWYGMKVLIKNKITNKVEYLKGIKEIVKSLPGYKNILQEFIDEITKDPISKEMISEKNNLLVECEKLVSNNKVEEALEIVQELNKIFNYDINILQTKGVILYLLGKYDEAILDLSIALTLSGDNFDLIYNLACVLEANDKKEIAKGYFKHAYDICEDENMKCEIEQILNKWSV